MKKWMMVGFLVLALVPHLIYAQASDDGRVQNESSPDSASKPCFIFCKKEEAPKESPSLGKIMNTAVSESEEAIRRAALSQLAQEMTTRLREIDVQLKNISEASEMDLNQLNETAYKLLADTQVKLGINPKVQLREKFLTPIKFPEGAGLFSHLDEAQREIVIETIQNFRGGLYMDLIRLWKRVALVYSKTLYATYEKSGRFLADDKAQILRILTMATVIPMPVVDKTGRTILVFEHEIAQPEFVRQFNRVIQLFIIDSAKLEMNEAEFHKHKEAAMDSLIGNVAIKFKQLSVVPAFNECMRPTAELSDDTPRGWSTSLRTDARLRCFNQHYRNSTTVDDCMKMANQQSDRIASGWSSSLKMDAQMKCFSKFNN